MDNMPDWERYIEKVVPIYKDYVDYWIVINEMNIVFEYSEEERIKYVAISCTGLSYYKKI